MRIILIDDDQLVTLSLKTILESTGSVQVLATGTSGAEAIALYQQWKPDVLLLDIQNAERKRTGCRRTDSATRPECSHFVPDNLFR